MKGSKVWLPVIIRRLVTGLDTISRRMLAGQEVAPLRHLHDSGAGYKYPHLLTYLFIVAVKLNTSLS